MAGRGFQGGLAQRPRRVRGVRRKQLRGGQARTRCPQGGQGDEGARARGGEAGEGGPSVEVFPEPRPGTRGGLDLKRRPPT